MPVCYWAEPEQCKTPPRYAVQYSRCPNCGSDSEEVYCEAHTAQVRAARVLECDRDQCLPAIAPVVVLAVHSL